MLAWQVQRWGHAAVFGDHPIPVNLMFRMSASLNYYDVTNGFLANAQHAAEWAKHNPSHLKMLQKIREMRTQNG